MPKRCDKTLDNFTLEIFRGAACKKGFTYNNPSGSPVDLTGKEVALGLTDIFDTTFKIKSSDPPTALGSYIQITDAADGEFEFKISDDETLNANLGPGRWWILLDGELLWDDVATVQDL